MLDHRGESMEFISTLDMVYSYRVALVVLLKTDSYVESSHIYILWGNYNLV